MLGCLWAVLWQIVVVGGHRRCHCMLYADGGSDLHCSGGGKPSSLW